MSIALRYAARTHLGLGPKGRNEDSGYAGPHLLVLADGMGGHAAGDVASSMIVGALAPLDEEGLSGEQALRVLEAELHDANARLREAMQADSDLAGMGSTTIAMLRAGNKLAMAHIGDSRAYLLREGTFSQITKDHSFVQRLLDEHRITPDEAQHHPQRSLVTRVMTGHPDDEPDLSIRELLVGDRYLLCSDGLTDFVGSDVVGEILAEAATPDEAAERCIEVALRASTRDNVTVVVADVVDSDDTDPPVVPQVVGAAAIRRGRTRTRAIPVSPAEKAAALTREASGEAAGQEDDHDEQLTLAEDRVSPRTLWLRRSGLAAAAAVFVVGGGIAGYQWTQGRYYLAADGDLVAVYRGVPQTLGPIHLSQVAERSDVLVADLPQHYQDSVRAGILVSDLTEARDRVTLLRVVAAECQLQNATGTPCGTSTPVGTPTTTSSPGDATSTTGPTALSGPTGGGSLRTAYVTVTIQGAVGPTVTVQPVPQPPANLPGLGLGSP